MMPSSEPRQQEGGFLHAMAVVASRLGSRAFPKLLVALRADDQAFRGWVQTSSVAAPLGASPFSVPGWSPGCSEQTEYVIPATRSKRLPTLLTDSDRMLLEFIARMAVADALRDAVAAGGNAPCGAGQDDGDLGRNGSV